MQISNREEHCQLCRAITEAHRDNEKSWRDCLDCFITDNCGCSCCASTALGQVQHSGSLWQVRWDHQRHWSGALERPRTPWQLYSWPNGRVWKSYEGSKPHRAPERDKNWGLPQARKVKWKTYASLLRVSNLKASWTQQDGKVDKEKEEAQGKKQESGTADYGWVMGLL